MEFKKLIEMLKNLGVKVENIPEENQQQDFTQMAELIKAITSMQQNNNNNNDSNSQNTNNNQAASSDITTLAALLAPMLTKTQEAPKAYEEGFYKDGQFNLDKIKDLSLKEALTEYTSAVAAKEQKRQIDDAVKTELSKRHLAIKEDAFMKLLDLKDVKVDGDKVTGVTEAFDALKDSGVYKGAPSSPLNQGFNPMENKNTDAVSIGAGGSGLYAAAAADSAE